MYLPIWLAFVTVFGAQTPLPPPSKVIRYRSPDTRVHLTLRAADKAVHGTVFRAFTSRLRGSVDSDRPLYFPFTHLLTTDSVVYAYDALYANTPTPLGKGVQVLFDFTRPGSWLFRLPTEGATVEVRRDHSYYSPRYGDSIWVFTCRPVGLRAVPWLPVVCRLSRKHGLVGLTMACVGFPFTTTVMDADQEDSVPERLGPLWDGREAEMGRISFRLALPRKSRTVPKSNFTF